MLTKILHVRFMLHAHGSWGVEVGVVCQRTPPSSNPTPGFRYRYYMYTPQLLVQQSAVVSRRMLNPLVFKCAGACWSLGWISSWTCLGQITKAHLPALPGYSNNDILVYITIDNNSERQVEGTDLLFTFWRKREMVHGFMTPYTVTPTAHDSV